MDEAESRGLTKSPRDPVQPKLAHVIANGLRSEIASGRLANGKRLPSEAELIARYGVSRAVVREALRLLESVGLIVVRRGPKGGAVVTDRTSGVVRESLLLSLQLAEVRLGEVYDCLHAILPSAARLAAESRPAETAAALRQHVLEQAGALDDLPAFSVQMQAFNQVVLAHCGNRALQVFASSLLDIVRRSTEPAAALVRDRMDSSEIRAGLNQLLEYQGYLASVVATGEGPQAEAVWKRYVEDVGERFFRIVPRDLPLPDNAPG